jgi:hypothetical protein
MAAALLLCVAPAIPRGPTLPSPCNAEQVRAGRGLRTQDSGLRLGRGRERGGGSDWVHADSLGDVAEATGCPEASWKREFFRSRAVQDRPGPVVVLDVGCNKGFDALPGPSVGVAEGWPAEEQLGPLHAGLPRHGPAVGQRHRL